MGSFATPTILGCSRLDKLKQVTFSVLGSGSYATGGDTLDISAATIGKVNGFTRVDGVQIIGQPTAANSKYLGVYIRAASGAAATGLIKFHDITAASDAEVSNATDLSGVTFICVATGQ